MKLFNIKLDDFYKNGIFHDEQKWKKCKKIAENYFKQIYNTQTLTKDVFVVKNIEKGPIKFNWDMYYSIHNLTLINYAIQYFIPNIWDNRKLPYYQNDYNKELLQHYYHSIKTVYSDKIVDFLNPTYSLFTAYIVIQYLLYGQIDLDHILSDTKIKQIFNILKVF